MTARVVCAQVTLNLDVLTEDFIPKETLSSETKKEKPAKKKPPVKKAVSPVKPKKNQTRPPEKPVSPQKPEVKKFQIKESKIQDEHDRLKPEAIPVPAVKITEIKTQEKKAAVSAENIKKQAAAPKVKKAPAKLKVPEIKKETETDEEPIILKAPVISEPEEQEPVIILKEPKLSKRFLEQERERQAKEQQRKTARENKEVSKTQEAEKTQSILDEAVSLKPVPAPRTLLSPKTERTEATQPVSVPEEPPVVKEPEADKVKEETTTYPSVIKLLKNLTSQERSDALLKEIPEESATKQAVLQGRDLVQVFVFQKTSAELTPEMKDVLNGLAATLKRSSDKRLIIYAYSDSTAPDYGRERQVSLRRALMIRSYLSQAGIRSLRVEIRSQGQKGAGNIIPNRADILIYER